MVQHLIKKTYLLLSNKNFFLPFNPLLIAEIKLQFTINDSILYSNNGTLKTGLFLFSSHQSKAVFSFFQAIVQTPLSSKLFGLFVYFRSGSNSRVVFSACLRRVARTPRTSAIASFFFSI